MWYTYLVSQEQDNACSLSEVSCRLCRVVVQLVDETSFRHVPAGQERMGADPGRLGTVMHGIGPEIRCQLGRTQSRFQSFDHVEMYCGRGEGAR
jgi:hypothetical protein